MTEIYYKDAAGSFKLVGIVPDTPVVVTPTPTPTPSPTSTLYDDFSGPLYKLTDGAVSPNGKWKCMFTGFGTVETKTSTSGFNYMYLAPKVSTAAGETHGSAVATTKVFKDFDLSLNVRTIKQLRTGSPPNNWETAWLNWNVIDQFHAFAFLLKMQGFQLEKKDNETQNDAAEIFLATGNTPSVRIGVSQKWRIKVTGTATGTPHVDVWIDGVQIINYDDNQPNIQRNSEKMKAGGTIALYTEDAAVALDSVNITPL